MFLPFFFLFLFLFNIRFYLFSPPGTTNYTTNATSGEWCGTIILSHWFRVQSKYWGFPARKSLLSGSIGLWLLSNFRNSGLTTVPSHCAKGMSTAPIYFVSETQTSLVGVKGQQIPRPVLENPPKTMIRCICKSLHNASWFTIGVARTGYRERRHMWYIANQNHQTTIHRRTVWVYPVKTSSYHWLFMDVLSRYQQKRRLRNLTGSDTNRSIPT